MARVNRLLNFIQDISLAVQKRIGDNTPINLNEIKEKILNIKNDNKINGIVKEYSLLNGQNFTIGEFVSLDSSNNTIIPFDKNIYGIVTEVTDNKISVTIPKEFYS